MLVGGVESENISVDKESSRVNFRFLPKAVCIKVKGDLLGAADFRYQFDNRVISNSEP